MDPVVEDAEIGFGRTGAGAEQPGRLRELLGGAPGFALGGEGVAQHQLVAALSIFAHHAAEVGGLHLLRPLIFDAQFLFGFLQGDMDLVVPRLLDRRGEDRRHLQLLVLGESHARQHRRCEAKRAEFQHDAPRQAGAPHFAMIVFH